MLSPLIADRVLCKKSILMLLLMSPMVLAQPCTVNDNCKIDVQFKGSFLENTCDLSINNGTANETVTLPTISTASLTHNGAEAGSQLFAITLSNCPINKAISLYFASTASGVNTATGNLPNATGNDYGKDVEIRLRKSDQQQMVIDNPDSSQDYDISNTAEVTHQFIASYYSVGTSGVSAGLVSAAASIIVNYK
ncbi:MULTISPECIES: fimbrial protein [Enterobacterales]|uniref:fimbrial protein n=1 Tax=Enterobacterales TaxID=91347 RepID=UPI002ED87936